MHSVAWERLPGTKVGINPHGHLQHAVRHQDESTNEENPSPLYHLGGSVHVEPS